MIMTSISQEQDLDEFIISASDMYEKTKPDRIKALQPVVQDMMLKIASAMKKSQSSITYQYSRTANASATPSLNTEQVKLITKLLSAKGYTVKDSSYQDDPRDFGGSSYQQLSISWSVA